MKKIISLVVLLCVVLCAACSNNSSVGSSNKNEIVIWTSGEDYKNDTYLKSLKEHFKDYNIVLEYMNSSTIASKINEEGENTTCDIVLSEEYNYLDMIQNKLVDLSKIVDFSIFLDDIVPESHKWTPEVKNGGCIMINEKMLNDKGLEIPKSYDDLLKDCYKNLISMPNPASSGTGYMFLRQLTNEWGEDKAFDYFEKLTSNVLQYTSSGSGPVNQLIQGEIAIALGMTSQGVTEKNNGLDINITFFDEGAPFSMYGNAIVKKSNTADKMDMVYEVFKYLSNELCKQNNEMYFPDQIFKDYAPEVNGFPKNIKYGNMKNDTKSEKERLLKKWTFS